MKRLFYLGLILVLLLCMVGCALPEDMRGNAANGQPENTSVTDATPPARPKTCREVADAALYENCPYLKDIALDAFEIRETPDGSWPNVYHVHYEFMLFGMGSGASVWVKLDYSETDGYTVNKFTVIDEDCFQQAAHVYQTMTEADYEAVKARLLTRFEQYDATPALWIQMHDDTLSLSGELIVSAEPGENAPCQDHRHIMQFEPLYTGS